MKRTVRAWWVIYLSRPLVDRGVPMIRLKRSEIVGWKAIPCTITYDDGMKPRREKKK